MGADVSETEVFSSPILPFAPGFETRLLPLFPQNVPSEVQ
jgi:hypothetical protein